VSKGLGATMRNLRYAMQEKDLGKGFPVLSILRCPGKENEPLEVRRERSRVVALQKREPRRTEDVWIDLIH